MKEGGGRKQWEWGVSQGDSLGGSFDIKKC